MSNSPPQENPYASPAIDSTPSRQASAMANLDPSALVPRWWEWLLCFSLLAIFGAIVWDSVYPVQKGGQFMHIDANPFFGYRNFVSSALGSGLGLVVLRIWWWRQLPGGLAPGHVILLAILIATLVSIGGYVSLVATLHLPFVNPQGTPAGVGDFGTIEFIFRIAHVIRGFGSSMILVMLMFRYGLWFAAACAYLLLGLFEIPYMLLSLEQLHYYLYADGIPAVLRSMYYTAWFLVMFSFVVLAVYERWRGVHRDWLHWTGIVCWATFLIAGIAGDVWRKVG